MKIREIAKTAIAILEDDRNWLETRIEILMERDGMPLSKLRRETNLLGNLNDRIDRIARRWKTHKQG